MKENLKWPSITPDCPDYVHAEWKGLFFTGVEKTWLYQHHIPAMTQEAFAKWSKTIAGLPPYQCLPWEQTYPPSTTLTRYPRLHRDADHVRPSPKTQLHREAVLITARAAACGPMSPFKGDGGGAHSEPLFFLSQSLFTIAPSHRQ